MKPKITIRAAASGLTLDYDFHSRQHDYRQQLARSARLVARLRTSRSEKLGEDANNLLDDVFGAAIQIHHCLDWIKSELLAVAKSDSMKELVAGARQRALKDMCDGAKHRGLTRKYATPDPLVLRGSAAIDASLEIYKDRLCLEYSGEGGPRKEQIVDFLERALTEIEVFCGNNLGLRMKDGRAHWTTQDEFLRTLSEGLEASSDAIRPALDGKPIRLDDPS